jgi:transcriptional regulator with XRE-family HTH domain
MDRQRLGRSVRALRQRLGWRQEDLARRCSVSQSTVSRIERGVVAGTALDAIERVVVGLGGELDVRVRWRGEELDRLLDAVHAAIVDRLVDILGVSVGSARSRLRSGSGASKGPSTCWPGIRQRDGCWSSRPSRSCPISSRCSGRSIAGFGSRRKLPPDVAGA